MILKIFLVGISHHHVISVIVLMETSKMRIDFIIQKNWIEFFVFAVSYLVQDVE